MAKGRRKDVTTPKGKSVWARSVELVGEPILLSGEDEKQYRRMFDHIAADIDPVGATELILVRDIATLIFDENRLRRLKLVMLTNGRSLTAKTLDERYASNLQFHLTKHVQLEQMIASIYHRRNEARMLLVRLGEIRAKKEAAMQPPIDAEYMELPPISAPSAPLALAAP